MTPQDIKELIYAFDELRSSLESKQIEISQYKTVKEEQRLIKMINLVKSASEHFKKM
jgi:SMC interacting uncharacterized protein involved in chromosome segregation